MSIAEPLLEEDIEQGGKINENIQDDFAYRNNVTNAPKSIRLGFIRKVYGLLSVQLLLTGAVAGVFMFTPPITKFVQDNAEFALGSCIASIFVLIPLYFKRKDTPTNFILLIIYTIFQAYSIGVIVSFSERTVVLEAIIITFLVFGGLTLYTFQTERDISSWYSGLFAGLIVLLVGGIVQVFVQSPLFELALAYGGALLFCFFIIFDTKLLMDNLSPEEYILATINLYLDILNLFLHILRILNHRS